jgi:hypothetical protein
MTKDRSGLPCELCGNLDGDCNCPPCSCKWCRDRRGEPVSELERAAIDRHVEAIRLEMFRAESRMSAERMRANIDRELARITAKERQK